MNLLKKRETGIFVLLVVLCVVVAIINHRNAVAGGAALDNLVQWVYQYGATWNPASQH